MAWLAWAFHRVGYVVRPYDMLADRRRWFWQPRQRCGWSQNQVPPEPARHPFFDRCPHGVQFLNQCEDCPGGWQPRSDSEASGGGGPCLR